MDYNMKFIFSEANETVTKVYRTSINLVTENNSWCGLGYYDGEVQNHFGKMGEIQTLEIKAKKYKFLTKSKETCRVEPYNSLFFERISEEILQTCESPCRPPNYYLCKYAKVIESLPICQNAADEQCYQDTKNKIANELLFKPCTKLQYKFVTTMWPGDKNSIVFEMKFPSPALVRSGQ